MKKQTIQTKDLSSILTKDFLIKEYLLNKKSTIVIGNELGCTNSSVSNYLIKYEIRRRTFKEASSGELNGMFGTHRKGKDNPNYKDGRYARSNCYCTVCEKKVTRVGKCQRCSWNARHKVKYCITCNASISLVARQCKKCQLENMPSGKNHPNWLGGISRLPYSFEFNYRLKSIIRKRDNYTCQNCSKTEKEELLVLGRKLSVHHIDYDKQNCKEENLTTLCNSCNLKVNSNRSKWTKHFKKKLV